MDNYDQSLNFGKAYIQTSTFMYIVLMLHHVSARDPWDPCRTSQHYDTMNLTVFRCDFARIEVQKTSGTSWTTRGSHFNRAGRMNICQVSIIQNKTCGQERFHHFLEYGLAQVPFLNQCVCFQFLNSFCVCDGDANHTYLIISIHLGWHINICSWYIIV